jgi:anti-sigma regulatory factor (Ser/Thr protein kinase)
MVPQLEHELSHRKTAAAEARRLLEDRFAADLHPEELETTKLLTSELVNNAVMHGSGKITFVVDFDRSRIRVDVVDEGSGFVHQVRDVGFDELSGRGLQIVEAISSRWGLFEGTTHVWFEVDRRLAPI